MSHVTPLHGNYYFFTDEMRNGVKYNLFFAPLFLKVEVFCSTFLKSGRIN